jgi:predicted  nucleic acid-binding Zn-ribbon protein
MNEIMKYLLKLQTLDFSETENKTNAAQIEELRGKIPAQILGHYDRLVARGKKGLAAVRNQVCTGCHMKQPLGLIMTLKHGTDIQLCDSCGRYLYLPDESASAPQVEIPRRRKAAVAA